MSKQETRKNPGLVERYNLNGIRLKTEPESEIALYVGGLLTRISESLPNPNLERIFNEALAEIEATKDSDPMTPTTLDSMQRSIDFVRENIIFE